MAIISSTSCSRGVSWGNGLTVREHEVLEMIATGLDNQQIARRLVLSDKTVRNRVSDILSKLHARSRAEMVALARDAGLGGP